MADLAFKDRVSNYCVVDVKTHREGTAFNMPNLTSVDRLARFYEDDSNYFVMLMVKYAVAGTKVTVQHVHFVPIEHLKWDCLTLGALGTGQIQIADSKHIEIDPSRKRRALNAGILRHGACILPARDREDHQAHRQVWEGEGVLAG